MSATDQMKKILVVEDEWLIAMDIERMLEEHGFGVVGPARNVAIALELIQSNEIDAAFLDINLGAEESFPIAERLVGSGVPVTFISAHARDQIPARFSGADLLSKPVTPQHLVQQANKMLEGR
ncbi:response regulator [Pseudorhodobacter sp.]|uniref:response regulator n=1 Tax=Pseudorhodobacter sp. TaxID=1934400 RepID=UPI00264A1758|nr:response regulator [Pseudorhodobacter sp.]MDN5787609.1 response regulator [Pseudorhodobacter sp.]